MSADHDAVDDDLSGDNELPEDEPDLWLPRAVDPAQVAARLAVQRALTEQGISVEALAGAIIIEVPSPDWVSPVSMAWRDIAKVPSKRTSTSRAGDIEVRPGAWMVVDADGSRSRHRPKYENEQIAESLWQGQSVLGVSHAPDRLLPTDLIRAADLRISLPPLNAEDLKSVAHSVTSNATDLVLAPEVCAAVSPVVLRLARRQGQSADDFLRRAEAIVARAASGAPRPAPSLDDLPGMDAAIAWGRDLARDLDAYGAGWLSWADIDRGCLLAGPPGTGKTTFARALAVTCGVPLVVGSYSMWQASREGHLGDLLKAMAATFDEARKAAPAILFIDELDSFYSRTADSRHRDWWASVVGALLEHLDGVGGREGVVVVGATNHPEMVDPAITRSGRLDRIIAVPLPDQRALAAILRVHIGTDLAGVDLTQAALLALGGTGADCERWARGARRRARKDGRPMTLDDLLAEIRGAGQMSPTGARRIAAVHEAGHALVQVLEQPGALQHVSIREDDQSGGHTAVATQSGDVTEAWLGMHLRRLLAGRAAEEVVLGHATGGSGGPIHSDLGRATWLAANAETAMGISARPLLWLGLWDERNLATLLVNRSDLAQRVEERLNAAYEEVCRRLQEHRPALDALVAGLLEREVLTGAEVEAIMQESR
ncbi:AAA family ATPase [Paracraurococcus lichenis]|uniref:AAA family ATPase n=1 Tax=Paracraurococcus lichenis TaxID=3064888 RepID=A0ABT9DY94_9PROT|nr:AAA family ATPase [Paracraurococcus sp. LOR1-02]MDO9708877.1 AAA family ATPase [Paracraurococcus sp. LOR1-02]